MNEGIVVIIASVHRPEELGRWVGHIERQTLKPLEMIWAITGDDDIMPAFRSGDLPSDLTIVRCPMGLTKQRNGALAAIKTNPEFIAFFDDDYVPTTTCLADIVRSFDLMPNVVGLTGTMLADGINSSGISYEDAVAIVSQYEQQRNGKPTTPPTLQLWDGLYGCNMALRADAIGDERFDENLPLYAWQEDVDFAVRVARGRKMGRTDGFAGVHQGVKNGRGSGKRLGYSQIVNPIYLMRKGSMNRRKALLMSSKNMLKNHLRFVNSEPWVDRRGRALGNWLGIWDVLKGRIDPTAILDL
ncbi:MAG: Group 1 glycosyl transferase [Sphingomonadales bacterium]|jgi:GT2 family glycosyltransferase|nr:Group 1 glycosyl transferase [Sphingomonadales bacterium]